MTTRKSNSQSLVPIVYIRLLFNLDLVIETVISYIVLKYIVSATTHTAN